MNLTELIQVRCSTEQKERWLRAAEIDRRKLADWIRIQLDDTADKVIELEENKKRK